MMKRQLAFVVLVVVALVAPPGARADVEHATHYYVSLGDSFAAGTQPTARDSDLTDEGYADQLHTLLAANDPKLRLVKLGCGGESTTSMILGPFVAGPTCDPRVYKHRYPHGTQLAEAVSFLHAHRQFVDLVAIDIGGNDVLRPDGGGVLAILANLPVILAALREAAGLDVPIVGMSYYNPGLVSWFDDPAALRSRIDGLVAFNDVLEGIYAGAGDPVAGVERAFSSTDTTLVGGIPLSVVRICQWTWMCAPPPLGPDIHPNAAGYGVIAHAFAQVLDRDSLVGLVGGGA